MEKAEKTLHEDKKKHFYFKKIIIFGKFLNLKIILRHSKK